MYKLLTGVNYTQGSMNLDDIEVSTISDVGFSVAKIIEEEKDAINFIFTVVVPELTDA